ncbi:MAG: STAS domain-containing protein [Clostridia bacterium]|nr:STAS domain-containing protein [Clostridia bacterium]
MEAVITKKENVLTVAPRGRLDTVNSASLKEDIDKSEPKGLDILLDFTDVDYISSAGLRLLVALQKQVNETGNKLTVKNPGKVVREVFAISGFNKRLNIE